MVVRLAYTYLKSFAEAEDAAQEVFLRLFKEDTPSIRRKRKRRGSFG